MAVTGLDEQASHGDLRELVASKDWASTPLGPMDSWSEALRTTVETCLGSRFPVIIFWGPALVQVYNDAYAPIIGAKHPDALGQTAEACFPEIWDVIGPMLHGVLERGEATWSDDLLLMLERKGFPEECYFTFSYSPAGGAPVEGVFCAVIETTRRVIGERRLDVLRDLSATLASARHTSLVLDRAVEVMSRHPSDLPAGLLRLLPGDGSVEDRWWSCIGQDDARDELSEVAAEAERTGSHALKAVATPDSGYQPGSPAVTAYPVAPPGSSEPVAVLAVDLNRHLLFDDAYRGFLELVASAVAAAISAARSYEEAEERAAVLEELDRAKTSFLSNVSHEFRTPLTLLLGPLHEHAGDTRLPEEVRHGLQMAERNARRLLKLVNNLLDFARLEAGRATASYELTGLADLTAEIAGQFQSAAESAGLKLVIECPPLTDPVYVDPEMWEQIVTNLCANALKYTRSGSVTVRVRPVADGVRLEVTDTGIGIPPDDVPFVFDRFRRAKSVGARTHEGTGLGLALVRELVTLHGGQVGVESEEGAGSTFTVTLPVGSAHLPAGQVAQGGGRGYRTLSSSTTNTVASLETLISGSGPATPNRPGRAPDAARVGTVYVIDDNADMRTYLCDLLGRHCSTVAFADARTALTAIETHPPDLIISDVMMPGMDGFSFLSQLRSRPATAQLPVILLSARAGEEAVIEGLEAGADDYLIKPFAAGTLVARVRSQLDLAELRRSTVEGSARHAAQLAFLATAAGDILAAETVEEIATVTELAARQVTGADECRFRLGEPESHVTSGLGEEGRQLLVPLAASNGQTIAYVRLTHQPGVTFSDEDHTLVTELARISARRIERIYQYEREHQVSDTLQRSLLPRTLPSVPGIEMVARYRPASEAAAVGGDWYDALLLPDGRLMLVVGDVIGHDLEAAVAMGELRHLMRAHALDIADPSLLCQTVNRLLPALGAGEMATAAVAFLDPGSGRVSIANAGHPPPVLVPASGPAQLLHVEPCPPLGALDSTVYHAVQTTLDPGATLVLYTDGLVERRGESIDVSLTQFAARCHVLHTGPLETALDDLLERALVSDSVTDDVAVLAVRRKV